MGSISMSGRSVFVAGGVLTAFACTVVDKGDYTFTDNPSTGGTGATKATGGASGSTGGKGGAPAGGKAGRAGTAGRGGTSSGGSAGTFPGGEAGMAGSGEVGGTSGSAGKGGTGGKGGRSGTGGKAGTGGTGVEAGAAGEGGMPSTGTCGDGTVDTGEQCDLGTNNGKTACAYGQMSCTVCTSDCKRAAGTATYCGDKKIQASHEQCDDGNTTTERCDYGNTMCTACDSSCKTVPTRTCGDSQVNGDKLRSITVETSGLWGGCLTDSMPFFLNGIYIDGVAPSSCACTTTVSTFATKDSNVLAGVRPSGNVFEVRSYDSAGYYTMVSWVRLTFNYENGTTQAVVPIDGGQASTNGVELCNDYQTYSLRSAPFAVSGIEQCDGDTTCDNCGHDIMVPGFRGEPGPVFDGWTQCEGYLDTSAGDELPMPGWAAACTGKNYNSIRMVCGPSLNQYRYLDVSKNIFRDGVTAYPETGIIAGTGDQNGVAFTPAEQSVYAASFYDMNTPVDGDNTWWGTSSGCGETTNSLAVDPKGTASFACTPTVWEVTGCFGQNLTGDRHLWVYVK